MSYDSEFLKLTKRSLLVVGIWPPNFSKHYLILAYKFYGAFILGIYSLFVVLMIVGFEKLLREDAKEQSVVAQFCLSYTFLWWQIILCRKESMKDMIRLISVKERDIMHDYDAGAKELYQRCVKSNNVPFYVIFYALVIICFQFIAITCIDVRSWSHVGTINATLPIPLWFPFDTRVYFKPLYYFEVVSRLIPAFTMLACYSLLFSLVHFAAIRLKLLGYNFKHFTDRTGAGLFTPEQYLKVLVREHKKIIEYINRLNKILKWFVSLDFLLRSQRIASVILNLLELVQKGAFTANGFAILLAITANFGTISLQMCCMYYFCNEIVLESVAIGTNIFHSDWYEHSPGIKRSLLIVLIRSQRSLALRIANLYRISNDLVVSVVKAAFTFMLLSLNGF